MRKIILEIIRIPNKVINYFNLKRKHVIYDKSLKINGRIRLYGRGRIIIGKNVRINSSLGSNPTGGDVCTILSTAPGATLEIGENSGISNCAIISRVHIKIGKNVKIGTSVKIYDTDFHSIDPRERIYGNDECNSKAIEIKDGAFIGGHSIILKGVTIGENSIIGAGSVVTKSVPDNQIWAGNPARFIKEV